MHLTLQFLARLTLTLALAVIVPVSMGAPIVFQAYDPGAASLAAAPLSQAASNSFDTATGPLNIYDFDTNTTGATFAPASYLAGCSFALCGGNTTSGGSGFYGAVYTTTITFAAPIDSFGAYFAGWQRDDQYISYTAGGAVNLLMPAGDVSAGGVVFFGFIDAGASITSITYSTALGDYVSIDDVRFGVAQANGAVPEPGTFYLLGAGAGLIGLVQWRRKR